MSQKIYDDNKTNQLIEREALQSKEGDFVVFGVYEHVNDRYTRVPEGMEICILSDSNYHVTDALVKQLKEQKAIHSLGYYKKEEWVEVNPVIYKEGDMVPNHMMTMFPQGMISQIGTSHTQGITQRISLENLWIHMKSANNNNKNIRCFWTANKLTNPVLHPQLLFHITKS
ncbi:hypothetical protein [Flammeovirga aprica]|uniref:Uncharacterized protein n=1 Tax=Flammeovirga aprica JL-4 TaxID=694437 RepID=A0A7X9RX77_9BACT|nr:hypothetical protein [Flammeovirga aprica]NME70386.1 hypothetical protein [Flammeovirga aprica JL-4]